MKIEWSRAALSDLVRIHDFYAKFDRARADEVIQFITASLSLPASFPGLGRRIEKYLPKDVHRFLVGDFELHYEVRKRELGVVRVWHTKEDR